MKIFALSLFVLIGTGIHAEGLNNETQKQNAALNCGDYGDDTRRTKRINKRRKRKCKQFAKRKFAG